MLISEHKGQHTGSIVAGFYIALFKFHFCDYKTESQCTIYRPWFQNVLSCSNFRIFFYCSVWMHNLLSLLSTFSYYFQLKIWKRKQTCNIYAF